MFIESETLELRKSLKELREGIISLSAMLNKSNKGELYLGIDDEKSYWSYYQCSCTKTN